MSECKHRRKDGVCLQDLEYVYKGYCVDAPCSCYEPQTNADKLRAMSDEELAVHLYRWDNSPLHASEARWLDWLRSPADKEGEG